MSNDHEIIAELVAEKLKSAREPRANGLDDISEAIGSLKSSVDSLDKTQLAIWGEIKDLRGDVTKQKLKTAKTSGSMGVVAAIATLGVVEGIRYWFRTQAGN
jgi:tRNA(Ile2) C34 agmatinyltransferase TiaS